MSTQLKTFYIAWNAYDKKIVQYSTEELAQASGQRYIPIESESYKEAKKIFLELYSQKSSETE